jgi:nitric oxide reductase NorD protein
MSGLDASTLLPSSTAPGCAVRRLDALMQQRETLRPLFRAAREAVAARGNDDVLEQWAKAVLALADVNAGPACLLGYWSAGIAASRDGDIAPLIATGHAAANICRHAGARAAAATIKAFARMRRKLDAAAMARWWAIMDDFAQRAPESVEAAAGRLAEIMPSGDVEAFADFVAVGLRLASGDRKRRLAFFSLQDEMARRMVTRVAAGIGFAELERQTAAFVTALWGRPPQLRSLPMEFGATIQRRSSIAGPLIRLPEFYRGVPGDGASALYNAAAAHAQAHLVLGGPCFAVGQLKPLQVALVTLVEDARIEWLAMRRFPGLRRLWAPYHVARPGGIATAPMLLARLARALFDTDYADDDGFVSKGRLLFAGALPCIDSPLISREIGMLLGNDLGQMRVQFNPKTYVVEPLYRDEGLGLWDFGDDVPASDEVLDVAIDAARTGRRNDPGSGEAGLGATGDPGGTNLARQVPAQAGRVIARYPEWDRVHQVERPDWTTVREVPARPGDPRVVEDALDRADLLRHRVRQLVRGVRIGRTVRLKRRHDGHDLDLDAVIEAGIALRTGRDPDPRIFRSSAAAYRDLAVLLLIDISQSTHDRLAPGGTILDVERLAVAMLAEAMQSLGDPFGLVAFASSGRDDVRMTTVKAFGEPYDRACVARLAGLSSGLSTRLGTALRHAGAVIGPARSFRKLVIVLTDGEPSDIDVSDPHDLIEDARRAALGLKAKGIDGFGVVLDPGGIGAAARIFGRGNTMLVHRAEELPARLSELYFRLARR